jgi:hypothetical protein
MREFRKDWNPYSACTETYYWDDTTKTMTIKNTYDVTDIIEQNKRRANASTDTRFGNEMFHHIAELPNGVVAKWAKEGYDVFSDDPDMKKKVMRRLHDPEWRFLRSTTKRIL